MVRQTKHYITRKNNKIKGGKVIGSGGFGCILKPAIKCANHSRNKNNNKNNITKLMKIRHAKTEYKDIVKYKKILKDIPNYTDYFF